MSRSRQAGLARTFHKFMTTAVMGNSIGPMPSANRDQPPCNLDQPAARQLTNHLQFHVTESPDRKAARTRG